MNPDSTSLDVVLLRFYLAGPSARPGRSQRQAWQRVAEEAERLGMFGSSRMHPSAPSLE